MVVDKDCMKRQGLFSFKATRLQATAVCVDLVNLKPYPPPSRRTFTSILRSQLEIKQSFDIKIICFVEFWYKVFGVKRFLWSVVLLFYDLTVMILYNRHHL